MSTFFKKNSYLIFVLTILLCLVGGYFVNHQAEETPLVTVSSHQHQLVRHEKNENKLTSFERFLEKQLSLHFTVKQMRDAAHWVVGLSLAILLLEPLLVWLLYRHKPAPSLAKIRQARLQRQPYALDRDTDRSFKPWS
ncbi:hypothetical protein [Lapidilactobacillus salsurivasis]